MNIKYKVAAVTLTAAITVSNAGNYYIKYKGIKLGEIKSLETLKERYLDAKVTNFIAKLLLRKKRFVFYEGTRPNIKEAKFRKDKNKILFALYEAIKTRPKYKKYTINDKKYLTLICNDNACTYTFMKRGSIKGQGLIEFDKNREFTKLTEQLSDVVIAKE